MESIPKDKILEYNPDTMVVVRSLYNLHKPGQMGQAIDALDAWIKAQGHFIRKDYSREYLERVIILIKGSVERAKSQLDKICTLRTMLPQFFNNYDDPKTQFQCLKGNVTVAVLPKLTEDHYRLLIIKYDPANRLTSGIFRQMYNWLVELSEYLKLHDYSNGLVLIIDFRNVNIMNVVSALNLTELGQISTIFLEAYDTRLKNLFILSESKAIYTVVNIFKQVMSEKLGKRIIVLKTVQELHERLPKELLPSDLGGNEKSMNDLFDNWLDVISTEENKQYLKEMSGAQVNESMRDTRSTITSEQFVGLSVAGTFRSLSFD